MALDFTLLRNMEDRTVFQSMGVLQERLDPLIHARVRLGIVSALAAGETLSFRDLKVLLSTSDGNLSRHAQKLEEAGYIECIKSFQGRMPLTEYRLTSKGGKALLSYVEQMEHMLQVARSASDHGEGIAHETSPKHIEMTMTTEEA